MLTSFWYPGLAGAALSLHKQSRTKRKEIVCWLNLVFRVTNRAKYVCLTKKTMYLSFLLMINIPKGLLTEWVITGQEEGIDNRAAVSHLNHHSSKITWFHQHLSFQIQMRHQNISAIDLLCVLRSKRERNGEDWKRILYFHNPCSKVGY